MLGAPQEVPLIIDDIGPRVSSKRNVRQILAQVFALFVLYTLK
jgi:hypothetical protein